MQAWCAFEQVEKSGCRAEFLGVSRALATVIVATNAASVTISLEVLRMASLPIRVVATQYWNLPLDTKGANPG